jgi:hypothetical protein
MGKQGGMHFVPDNNRQALEKPSKIARQPVVKRAFICPVIYRSLHAHLLLYVAACLAVPL